MEIINFGRNFISGQGLECLSDVFNNKILKNLVTLDISRNPLKSSGLTTLLSFLTLENCPNLIDIKMDGIEIDSDGLDSLSEYMRSDIRNNITRLSLNNCIYIMF